MKHTATKRLGPALLAVLALFTAACGDDDDDTTPTPDAPAAQPSDDVNDYDETGPVGFKGDLVVHGKATDNGREAGVSGIVYNDSEYRISVNVVAGNSGNQPVESYGITDLTLEGKSEKSFRINGLSNGEHAVSVVEQVDPEEHADQFDVATVTIDSIELTNPVTPGFLMLYVTPVCVDGAGNALLGVKLQDTSDENHESALVTHSLDGEVSEDNTYSLEDGGTLSLSLEAPVGEHTLRMEYEDDLGFRGEATTTFTIVPCDLEVEGRPTSSTVAIHPAAA